VRLSRPYPSVSEDIRLSVRETAEGFQPHHPNRGNTPMYPRFSGQTWPYLWNFGLK
jgi:hypothetical protein